MEITIIGTGCGSESLSCEAFEILQKADLIIGARRVLDALPPLPLEKINEYRPEAIRDILLSHAAERVCIVMSGDIGFYSGARSLLPLLEEAELAFRVIPGISSVQFFAAKLRRPWQDWLLISAHGAAPDLLSALMRGVPVFCLTDSVYTPAVISQMLCDAGLGFLMLHIGENLGSAAERIISAPAEELISQSFSPLCVVLIEAAPIYPSRVCGIPDDEFIRSDVPMTKQEIRASALAKMAVHPDDVCWDIGAGTGSVSVELGLHCRAVWAMEKNPAAYELAEKNRRKFCVWNLHLVQGTAPDGLDRFPVPDAAFIGGSSGNLREIVAAVQSRNPSARICITAIALETLSEAVSVLKECGRSVEVSQVSVSHTRKVGELNLLTAQNPVFIILGQVL